jgi:pimeloyl-ACP methyl ester carboxylesterase
MAPFAFVERSNVEAIRMNAARDELRGRLARHHDDVDTIFDGWRDLWTDPDFASWSIEEDLGRLRCPVLAILGDRDEYCTPGQVERIAETATHARVEKLFITDCGHAPHRDHAEVVLEAIDRFISGEP